MTNLSYVLKRVRAGHSVRFRQDFYSGAYAVCHRRLPWYPTILLRLNKGVKLPSEEVAEVKAEILRVRKARGLLPTGDPASEQPSPAAPRKPNGLR